MENSTVAVFVEEIFNEKITGYMENDTSIELENRLTRLDCILITVGGRIQSFLKIY